MLNLRLHEAHHVWELVLGVRVLAKRKGGWVVVVRSHGYCQRGKVLCFLRTPVDAIPAFLKIALECYF